MEYACSWDDCVCAQADLEFALRRSREMTRVCSSKLYRAEGARNRLEPLASRARSLRSSDEPPLDPNGSKRLRADDGAMASIARALARANRANSGLPVWVISQEHKWVTFAER